MKKNITIINCGSGNILSAKQSFVRVIKKTNIDADVCISGNPESIKKSTHIVLPGQGAFETCINGLKGIPGMIDELNDSVVAKKKPFFGICVGMQLLANNSLENGDHKGLGWIDGTIEKLPNKYETIIEVSKNIKDSDEIKEILESLTERKKSSTDLRRTGLVTIFVGIGLAALDYFGLRTDVVLGVGLLVMFIGIGQMFAGYVYPNQPDEINKAVEGFEKE